MSFVYFAHQSRSSASACEFHTSRGSLLSPSPSARLSLPPSSSVDPVTDGHTTNDTLTKEDEREK